MRRLYLAIALLSALLCVTAVLAATTRATYISCTPSTACFPWNTAGPACGRGANINMRFQVQLNPANYVTVSGSVVSNVTYAFCPRVDELQAFNISSVGSLTYTYVSSNNGTIMLMDGVRDTAWVSAIGFGNTDDVNFPPEGSAGRVMIADVFSYNNAGRSQCPDGQMGIVPFLVMNITLNNGKFQYFDGYNYPAGSGFVPSCDSGDVCLFDSASPCIGPRGGRKNCGQCVNAVDARNSLLQIWASYYGTDSQGRTLRSGASNPLNFEAYSGKGVASSMRKSFTAAQNGQQLGSDSLQAG